MWQDAFLALNLILLLTSTSYPLDRKLIKVETLQGQDEYLATGLVPFPPEVIFSTDNLRIVNALSNREVPSFIIEQSMWSDGSLMLVKMGFVVRSEGWRTQQYWLEWGEEISRHDSLPEDKLATVSFRVVEGVPDETEDIINVGAMTIRVEERPVLIYYWYLVPALFLLSIVIWRKLHLT